MEAYKIKENADIWDADKGKFKPNS